MFQNVLISPFSIKPQRAEKMSGRGKKCNLIQYKTLHNDFNPLHCYVKQRWDYWEFTWAEGWDTHTYWESQWQEKNPDFVLMFAIILSIGGQIHFRGGKQRGLFEHEEFWDKHKYQFISWERRPLYWLFTFAYVWVLPAAVFLALQYLEI